QAHFRQALDDALDHHHTHRIEITPETRQRVETQCSELRLFVLEQTTHQFFARVVLVLVFHTLRPRQQHARLDLQQGRGHQQIVRGQLEIVATHRFDIAQVLPCQRRHRDVEDVEIRLAYQVQQQVQ